MAAFAVARAERSEQRRLTTTSAQAAAAAARAWLLQGGQRRFVPAAFEREGVAAGAVGLAVRPEARARLARSMLDGCLLRVARAAALRCDFADLTVLEAVTAVALDALLENVSAVSGHRAGNLPRLLNVDARLGLVTAGRDDRRHQHGRE